MMMLDVWGSLFTQPIINRIAVCALEMMIRFIFCNICFPILIINFTHGMVVIIITPWLTGPLCSLSLTALPLHQLDHITKPCLSCTTPPCMYDEWGKASLSCTCTVFVAPLFLLCSMAMLICFSSFVPISQDPSLHIASAQSQTVRIRAIVW